jgi:hypothetical protein
MRSPSTTSALFPVRANPAECSVLREGARAAVLVRAGVLARTRDGLRARTCLDAVTSAASGVGTQPAAHSAIAEASVSRVKVRIDGRANGSDTHV